jgi:hypothetical protein
MTTAAGTSLRTEERGSNQDVGFAIAIVMC